MNKITRTITETTVRYKVYNRVTGLMEEVENTYLGKFTKEKIISRLTKDYKNNTNYIFIDVITLDTKREKCSMMLEDFIINGNM